MEELEVLLAAAFVLTISLCVAPLVYDAISRQALPEGPGNGSGDEVSSARREERREEQKLRERAGRLEKSAVGVSARQKGDG